MNKIMLIGHLGKDPEMNYTENGIAITKFSLAVKRFNKNATGERETITDWFTIVVWQKLAETCATYLSKGQKVFIGGRLSMSKYKDREGVQRVAVEVIANEMEMLSSSEQQSTDEDEAEALSPKQPTDITTDEVDALLAELEKQG